MRPARPDEQLVERDQQQHVDAGYAIGRAARFPCSIAVWLYGSMKKTHCTSATPEKMTPCRGAARVVCPPSRRSTRNSPAASSGYAGRSKTSATDGVGGSWPVFSS